MSRVHCLALAICVGPLLSGTALALPAIQEMTAPKTCDAAIIPAQQALAIPSGLLDAISKVESGRWDDSKKMVVAWPWTINVQGQSKFFSTKQEAVAEVQRLWTAGVVSIDVGCMQVNLKHHPAAFADLDEAFDPASNVAYAARYLRGLYDTTGGVWVTAAGFYHSQTPQLASDYRARLTRFWIAPGHEAAGEVVAPAANSPLSRSRQITTIAAEWREKAREKAGAYHQVRLAEYMARRQSTIHHS